MATAKEKSRAMSPAVTVIIVNFNSGDRLARCLRHLAAQTSKNFDVIVFDNASSDGSERAAETDTPGGPIVRLMRSEDNIGFAAGNNRASTEASGQWLAFLNPDAYADPDWIEQLLSGAERHAGVEVFGSTQLNADAPDIIDGAGDVYHAFGVPYRGGFGWPAEKLPGGDRECFAPCAAAALFRRSTFEALGGFEETFFCYGEDVDLGFRHRLAGGRAVQLRGAVVLHEGSGITGRHSDFTIYHGHRNRLWTYYRNMPTPLLIATAPFHVLVNIYLFFRLALAGGARAYLRGVRDALKGLAGQNAGRRRIQETRQTSLSALASALCWSPIKVARRAPDLRPIRSPASVAADGETA